VTRTGASEIDSGERAAVDLRTGDRYNPLSRFTAMTRQHGDRAIRTVFRRKNRTADRASV